MAEIFEPTIARVMKLLTKQYEAAGKRTSMDSAVKVCRLRFSWMSRGLVMGFTNHVYKENHAHRWFRAISVPTLTR